MTRTRASLGLALTYAIVTVVEFVAEDLDIPLSAFTYSWRLDEMLAYNPERVLSDGRVVIRSSRVESPLRREVRVGESIVTVEIAPGYGEYDIDHLYTSSLRIIRVDSVTSSMIREKALSTTRDGVEYMFIFVDSGDVAVLEGEHFKVRLPFVKSTATLHTHPEGACGLSKQDVLSGLDVLSSGGLFAAAATPSCIAFMLRRGLVNEDDYIRIREIIHKGEIRRLPATKFETVLFGFTNY